MNERILIVDDEAGIRAALAGILEDGSYRVSEARTAAEAREALRRDAPDLVLLDLTLPDQDGLELLELWRRERLDLPVFGVAEAGVHDRKESGHGREGHL